MLVPAAVVFSPATRQGTVRYEPCPACVRALASPGLARPRQAATLYLARIELATFSV